MAQTNFTPILTYRSNTAAAVPSAGNLTNSANGAELAVNTADKRLFTKDSGGNVVEIGTNPSSVTLPNGTANGVVYANGSKVLTTNSAFAFDGTTLGIYNGTAEAQRLNLGTSGTNAVIQATRASGTVPQILFQIDAAEQMRLTNTGLGIGTSLPGYKLTVAGTGGSATVSLLETGVRSWGIRAGGAATGTFDIADFTAGATRLTLDASGNLGLGATSRAAQERLSVVTTGVAQAALFKNDDVSKDTIVAWSATTSGTNQFVGFYTEASLTPRGGITYNRGLGLTAYNTTSDYRAKDIIGPVENSGAVIDSVPVYMGKMKGATQERPMFIAHEVPAYAHTGEKDAVDAEGKPVYQQMDASTLVPVMWAEIQSLRQRLAAAGI